MKPRSRPHEHVPLVPHHPDVEPGPADGLRRRAGPGYPGAVYRRRAYDYGVIHLSMEQVEEETA